MQQKYNLSVSQSREALDELKIRGDLTVRQHEELLKIVGFRNVLVHDYLEINNDIVQAVVTKRHYAIIDSLFLEWQHTLTTLPDN